MPPLNTFHPFDCMRCGHRLSEHGDQYPRPCQHLTAGARCYCRSFFRRMADISTFPKGATK